MKSNIGLAAALAGLVGGVEFAAKHPGIASRNRHHDDRAKPGSIEETERLCTAQLKRERKNAKRAREAAALNRSVEQGRK